MDVDDQLADRPVGRTGAHRALEFLNGVLHQLHILLEQPLPLFQETQSHVSNRFK